MSFNLKEKADVLTGKPTRSPQAIQGFLTSRNRFVDREEAAELAFQNGQIAEEKLRLYSEDLW